MATNKLDENAVEIEVLFIDEHLCVVNKQAGHVVHRTRGATGPVVLQTLRDQLGQHVYPVHRLDGGTSGCLAFALSSEVAAGLQASLQSDLSVKKYTALCRGHLESEGVYDRPLTGEKKQKQEAITKYRVLKEFDEVSLLELQLITGRRHQIRRHLAHEVHQIIGDVNYGRGWLNRRFRENYDFHRMFLHCHELSFDHPVTGDRINIQCPLPKELTELLDKL